MSEAGSSPADPPQPDRPRLIRWIFNVSEATGYLAGGAMVLATLVTAYGVFIRYVLGKPTVWQTEATIYLLMFVTFIGAVYGLKHHAHVGVDLVVERLPARGQIVTRILTSVVCLVVIGVVAWTSFLDWREAYLQDYRSPSAWRFPLWIAYGILPLGMVLLALQYLAMIAEGIAALAGRIPLREASLIRGGSERAQIDAELGVDERPGGGS